MKEDEDPQEFPEWGTLDDLYAGLHDEEPKSKTTMKTFPKFPKWRFWNPLSGFFGGMVMACIMIGLALAGLMDAAFLVFLLGLLLYARSVERKD